MSEPHECGHTPEEHQAMLAAAITSIQSGDISALLPQASNEGVVNALYATITELIIRAETIEDAKAMVDKIVSQANNIFFTDTPEHLVPADQLARQAVMDQRDAFHGRVAAASFEEEAASELNALFEQHGVQQKGDQDEDPPASTGFYL